ncbi:hypothetical protein BTO06_09615 [Tenacibaculum sp. SZ-18]|nr:hypothetical protein BTO06_09615 [Tenacibaculum sp. SZ-18]
MIQKNNKDISSKNKSLSIQFSLDGFSFCVKDITNNEIIVLTKYLFDRSIESPNLLLEKIQSIFETDKELQVEFDKIIAIHQNQLTTQIPSEFFDEDNLKTYIDFNIKTFESDYITFDNLPSLNAKNVYIPYVNINNFLFQNFGEFEFKHHSSILIEKIFDVQKGSFSDTLYVHVNETTLDVIVFKNTNFTLYNSFQYNSKEDFLYYILFVSEQLELNLLSIQVQLLGSISENSDTFTFLKEYISNIKFLEFNCDFLQNSETFVPHSNYLLLS